MAESWIQVAVDGVGKRVRNILLVAFSGGQDVYQQVVTLAKSDGGIIDDPSRSSVAQPVTVAALPLPTGAATDTSLATLHADIAAQARLVDTQPVSVAAFPADQLVHQANFDVAASTLAKDATVAKDATLGAVIAQPGAYTVMDRLSTLGLKIDATNRTMATEATLRQLLAAIQNKPKPSSVPITLLHRS